MSPRRSRSFLVLGCAAVLASLLLVLFHALTARSVHRFLGQWEEAGLPGQAPRGNGPRLSLAWPPQLAWSDIEWDWGESLRVSCPSMRIVLDPSGALRGKAVVDRLVTGRIALRGVDGRVPAWFNAMVVPGDSVPRSPSAVEDSGAAFETGEIVIEREGLSVGRLSGTLRLPRRGEWALIGSLHSGRFRTAVIRAHGRASAGASELRAGIDLSRARSIEIDLRTLLDKRRSWHLAGRDDGGLAAAVSPDWLDPPAGTDRAGSADFHAHRSESGALDGEAHLDRYPLHLRGDSTWLATGVLCLERGALTLQDLDLEREGASARIAGELPLLDGGEGGLHMRTVWGDVTRSVDGIARRDSGRWSLEVPKGGGLASLFFAPPDGDPGVDLTFRAFPLADLLPWLPFHPAGSWTGIVDGVSELRRGRPGWNLKGRWVLRQGSIVDLPLLEEIASFGGPRTIRYEQATMGWRYEGGAVLLDSLHVVGSSVEIQGMGIWSPPDSLIAWLRLNSGRNRSLGAFFRLLSGDAATLDLSVSGDPDHPSIAPLDRAGSTRWRATVAAILSGDPS